MSKPQSPHNPYPFPRKRRPPAKAGGRFLPAGRTPLPANGRPDTPGAKTSIVLLDGVCYNHSKEIWASGFRRKRYLLKEGPI